MNRWPVLREVNEWLPENCTYNRKTNGLKDPYCRPQSAQPKIWIKNSITLSDRFTRFIAVFQHLDFNHHGFSKGFYTVVHAQCISFCM